MFRKLLLFSLFLFLSVLLFAGERSSQWTKTRNLYVSEHPQCAVCGSKKKLEVHHIQPFHKNPDLERSSVNLITLCTSKLRGGLNCHLIIGHFGNFKKENPNVKRDAEYFYTAFISSFSVYSGHKQLLKKELK